MEIQLPFFVEYEVKESVPIADIIASLEANRDIFAELPSFLEAMVPGLVVEKVDLRVRDISHGSLREMFFAALFVAFQEELKKEIPALLDAWFGIPAEDKYDTVLTVSVMLIIYVGVDYVMQRTRKPDSVLAKEKIDELIAEIAEKLHVEEGHIRSVIGKQLYQRPKRIKKIAEAALKFFRPSKRQKNEAIVIQNRTIDQDFVRQVPYEAEYDERDDELEALDAVIIDIHAKDIDKGETGWAGTIRNVFDKRLRMKLMAPVNAERLWEKDCVKADVLVVKKQDKDGTMQPTLMHVTKIYRDIVKPATKPKSKRRRTK